MQRISRKICLEPYKSRSFGVLPSYDSNGNLIKEFGENKQYKSNYGLIPNNLKNDNDEISYHDYNKCLQWIKKYNFYNETNNIDKINELPTENSKNIDETYNEYKEKINSFLISESSEAYFTIPLLITTSIDDIGEFSIFYNEWEQGKEYNQGEFVFYNDNLYIKNDKGNGSIFSKKYLENYFAFPDKLTEYDKEWYDKSEGMLENDEEQWIKAPLKNVNYKKDNIGEFSIKDGKVVFNPTVDKMKYVYPINNNEGNGFFIIDYQLYKVIDTDYILYRSSYYQVYEYDSKNIFSKYCIINGIRYDCKSNGKISIDIDYEIKHDSKFIIYKNKLIKINNNKITINNNNDKIISNLILGYVDINNIRYYVSSDSKIGLPSQKNNNNIVEYYLDTNIETLLGDNSKMSEDNHMKPSYEIINNELYYYKEYVIYLKNNTLSGITDSKLEYLATKPLGFDEMGNQLPCPFIFDENHNNISLKEEKLDFPYKVGNTSNLSSFESHNNFLWGNIITNIKFYYLDDKKNEKIILEVNEPNSFINDLISNNDKFLESDESSNYIKDLRCDITYYMGGIIKINDNGEFDCSNIKNGVKYIDKTHIKEDTVMFKRANNKTVSLKYFYLTYDKYITKFDEYSNKEIVINQSNFNINSKLETNDFREENNGFINAPIFREEYKLGSSSKEKIDSNIYIDRGISSSYEKHLKLLEVNSLESLEQYGNGFYNIIKN